MSNNTILEYVWLDGYSTPNLRSKIKVVKSFRAAHVPRWNFDGSSTAQAPSNDSECLLEPIRTYKWSNDHYFVLCEVLNSDGTPHESNTRAGLRELQSTFEAGGFWWGFEQEYFITNNGTPLGFPENGYPEPQGLYYCGVGRNQVAGRDLAYTHLTACLRMGIELTGINAEVAIGQWEFQCFAKDTLKACDDLWMSRYLLYKMAEDRGWDIDISPKPISGNWNGSGCHANFSNTHMREVGGKKNFTDILESLKECHLQHIEGYGEGNEARLTGFHETQHIRTFSWGLADRGASIRVPSITAKNGWRGYLEDRRPASNCNPYSVAKLVIDAITNTQFEGENNE